VDVSSTVKIVVVEDHDLVREGIRDYLASLPRYQVVGEARTARDAFPIIEATKPDIVLMDIALPGMDGVVATREILRRLPRTRIVILSAHHQNRDVSDALGAGAAGYALKADDPETLLKALDGAVRGVPFLSAAVAESLSSVEKDAGEDDILAVLTDREREVFRLAADCGTSPEIAQELCLSRKTVDNHLNRINRKLGLHDRAQLVRLAARVGLVHSIRRDQREGAHVRH
jgi:NarL family two-component system response regulator LiaR